VERAFGGNSFDHPVDLNAAHLLNVGQIFDPRDHVRFPVTIPVPFFGQFFMSASDPNSRPISDLPSLSNRFHQLKFSVPTIEPLADVLALVQFQNVDSHRTAQESPRNGQDAFSTGRVIVGSENDFSPRKRLRILRQPRCIRATSVRRPHKTVFAKAINVFLPSQTKTI
jgi:hypothetical protein